MKISQLTPQPENPRTVTPEKLAQLKKALVEFGDLGGVVFNVKTKHLVGGHRRVENFDEAEIVYTKKYAKPTKTGTVAEGYIVYKGERYGYREVSWPLTREKAANIAANKNAGEWDLPQLGEWLKELSSFDVGFDMQLTMFGEDELEDLLPTIVKEHTRIGPTGIDEDDVPERAPARAKLGDVYRLGNHRVACGDSTDNQAVRRLMKGAKADICFTSPPYNLGSNASMRGFNASSKKPIYLGDADEKSSDDYLKFMVAWSKIAIDHAKYLFCNVQCLAGNKIAISEYWHAFRSNLVDIMIWDKEHGAPAMAPNVLNSAWEFIFILANEDCPKRSIKSGEEFRGTVPNIYRLNPVGKKDELAKDHGAVFPVQFAEHFVEHFSKDSVLDLFGGSGSTLIACEKTGRKCFMMELDPHYVDVIIERWEKYTGETAKRVASVKNEPIRKKTAEQSSNSHAKNH